MKTTITQKREEQEKLLMEIFIVGNTEEEIQNGYLNYELIKNSLLVLKSKSLMRRKNGQSRDIENLLDASINDRIQLGIMKKRRICLNEVSSATYSYLFKYKKSKGEGGKKRIHTDDRSIVANSEDSAKNLLTQKISQLGEDLVEILEVSKKLHSVTTIKGDQFPHYAIELYQ